MRFNNINSCDIVNGVGISCSLFTQGCNFHCKKCFNSSTWDFNAGKEFTEEIENDFIKFCKKDYINCISILGGEPFEYPKEILKLVQRIKLEINKPIFIWSGYLIEDIKQDKDKKEVLNYIDYLIDGQYIDELKDYTLHLRGSSNQRIWQKNNNIWEINNNL